ncbi:MAG: right-handed parallel beta-helix repeat-containing protein [Deltaproteobacteria bacterium]|nr:right-handed parallel beta-helix repeat-containing protein [Deltaproteobacteria bacterium]
MALAFLLSFAALAQTAKPAVERGDALVVQKAIDAAGPGDVVVIQAGEYRGGFLVSGKRSLTIEGHGSRFKLDNGERTIIEIRECGDITIEGIEAVHDVQRCTTGGVLSIADSDGVTIRKVSLDGTGLFGARIRNSRNVTIEDSRLTHCIASGLIVEGSSGVSSRRNVIALNGKRELSDYYDHPGDVAGIEIRKSERVDIVQNTVVANRLMPGIRNVSSRKVRVRRSILFANQGPPIVGDPAETRQAANYLRDPHFADLKGGDFRLRPGSPALSSSGETVGARPVAADLLAPPYCAMPRNKCRGLAAFACSADGKLAFLTWGGPASACGDANILFMDTSTGEYLHHQSTANTEPGCPKTTSLRSWAAAQAELGKQIAKHGLTCRDDLACHELPHAFSGGPRVSVEAFYSKTGEEGARAYEVILYLETAGKLSRAIAHRFRKRKLEIDDMSHQLCFRACHALIEIPTEPARIAVACMGHYDQDLFCVPAGALSTRGLQPNCHKGPRPDRGSSTWTHAVDATAALNLRQQADRKARVLAKLAPGSKVRFLYEASCHQTEVDKDLPGGESKRVRAPWYRVDTGSAVGWIHSAFLQELPEKGSAR